MKTEENTESSTQEDWLKVVLYVKQVSKGSSGGRSFSYSVMSIVGNKKDKVGLGYGKSSSVADAVKKSFAYGLKHAERFTFGSHDTVPFSLDSHYHSSQIFIKPAYKGSGLRCDFVTRTMLNAIGIYNATSKAYGSKHKRTRALAVLELFRKIDLIKDIRTQRKVKE